MKNHWLIPLIALLVLGADALSKQWALAHLTMGNTAAFMPGLLQLTLTTNTGGAWGIGHDIKYLMTVVPILICAGILKWLATRISTGDSPLSTLEQVGFGSVLGGAFGNICERLYRGHVTDFLEFAFMPFPIFNVADALIDVGVALIILHSLLKKQPELAAQEKSQTNGEQKHDS